MVVLIIKEWFVNQDKSIKFYDNQKYQDFFTGNVKQIVSEDMKKVKNN